MLFSASAKATKLFSSKWLVGFSTRHKKKIALRVVDYGLSGPLQTRQKVHPGRMESFEQMLRDLFLAIGIDPTQETIQQVQNMWNEHVESPKTRKVFARKGRKNVRLTIGLPTMEPGGLQKTFYTFQCFEVFHSHTLNIIDTFPVKYSIFIIKTGEKKNFWKFFFFF